VKTNVFCRHSWPDCALASWKKWPNPRRPDVLSVDLINKEFDEETGVLRATRLVMLKSWIPNWLKPITGSSVCFFLEESVTDPQNERLVLSAKNITLNNLVEMEETCVYTRAVDNQEWCESLSKYFSIISNIFVKDLLRTTSSSDSISLGSSEANGEILR